MALEVEELALLIICVINKKDQSVKFLAIQDADIIVIFVCYSTPRKVKYLFRIMYKNFERSGTRTRASWKPTRRSDH